MFSVLCAFEATLWAFFRPPLGSINVELAARGQPDGVSMKTPPAPQTEPGASLLHDARRFTMIRSAQ